MAIQKIGNSDNMYLKVIWGNLVQEVNESNPEAVRRDYELKDGTKGTKYEIAYKNLSWIIVGLNFKDSDYWKSLVLTLQDWADQYVISLWTESRYFTDLAKKLPNIKLEEPIEFNPYDFKTKDGKQLRGVSIKQDWAKIADAYWDGKKSLKGTPSTTVEERKEYDSDDWKSFFIKVKKFLIKEVEKITLPEIKEDDLLKEANDIF